MLGSWRFRRVRAPLIAAALILLFLYHFSSLDKHPQTAVDKLKEYSRPPSEPQNVPQPAPIDLPVAPLEPAVEQPPPRPAPGSDFAAEKPDSGEKDVGAVGSGGKSEMTELSGTIPQTQQPAAPSMPASEAAGSMSRPHVAPEPEVVAEGVEWTNTPEHFPVPEDQIIRLPTGTPKVLPRIQAKFEEETNIDRQERLRRQKSVKAALMKDWEVYKTEAWGRDEVVPVSGGGKDTFGGWGATLVDALDTLWIMDLKDEFELAVAQVAKINFKTTTLASIPVFETTIRYLGGLLGAYDVSGQKYQVLLEKAVEIGDILYGAFDTHNRMPQLYFKWKPQRRKNPAHSEGHAIMSEIGSLSMEFTRLAQLTGNNSYYDAIARVTNAIDDLQKRTAVPGLWPTAANAKGCKKQKKAKKKPAEALLVDDTIPEKSDIGFQSTVVESGPLPETELKKKLASSHDNAPLPLKPRHPAREGAGFDDDDEDDHLFNLPLVMADDATVQPAEEPAEEPVKEPEPKLGPVEDKPKPLDICEAQLDVSRDNIQEFGLGALIDSLYEYLIKQYLLLGGVSEAEQYARMYTTAMDVVTSKLLFRPQVPNDPDILFGGDLHVGPHTSIFLPITSHLGCFTGGMFALGSLTLSRPNDLPIAHKLSTGCAWAYSALPSGIMPELFHLHQCPSLTSCHYTESAWLALHKSAPRKSRSIRSIIQPDAAARKYVTRNRIPEGFEKVDDPRYIMRPEAIESVWYMYRVTGDPEWMDRGWRMWEAVNKMTESELAHSAIGDVTVKKGDERFEFLDSLESFWFGETLKYFYLLFSEPELISLDDYVLNTEAHPFLRPKPPAT